MVPALDALRTEQVDPRLNKSITLNDLTLPIFISPVIEMDEPRREVDLNDKLLETTMKSRTEQALPIFIEDLKLTELPRAA